MVPRAINWIDSRRNVPREETGEHEPAQKKPLPEPSGPLGLWMPPWSRDQRRLRAPKVVGLGPCREGPDRERGPGRPPGGPCTNRDGMILKPMLSTTHQHNNSNSHPTKEERSALRHQWCCRRCHMITQLMLVTARKPLQNSRRSVTVSQQPTHKPNTQKKTRCPGKIELSVPFVRDKKKPFPDSWFKNLRRTEKGAQAKEQGRPKGSGRVRQ